MNGPAGWAYLTLLRAERGCDVVAENPSMASAKSLAIMLAANKSAWGKGGGTEAVCTRRPLETNSVDSRSRVTRGGLACLGLPIRSIYKTQDRIAPSMLGRNHRTLELILGLGARKTKLKTATRVGRGSSKAPPICFFHVGKTGGTYIKSIIKKNGESTENLVIIGHGATLAKTRNAYGGHRRIAFMFRCPYERFVSAFYSRLRQGRPRNDSLWSAEEAAAYRWFEDANTLAECLFSENERERSAANFAMHAITHLKRNYTYHFQSVEHLKKEAHLIELCVNTKNIDDNLMSIMSTLGYEDFEMPGKRARHAASQTPPELSEKAKRNLQCFWENDFALYEYFRNIESFRGDAFES